jgi:cobalt-zinc-cadmium efflux system protein
MIEQLRREEGSRVAQHDTHDHHTPPHGHGPGDRHGHSHGGDRTDYGRAFAIGIGLNLAYVAAEAGFGVV